MNNKHDHDDPDDAMQPEYDFSDKQGVRGKYYQRVRDGCTIKIQQPDGTTVVHTDVRHEETVVLDPDVREYFHDAAAVNSALRGLIQLIPVKHLSAAQK